VGRLAERGRLKELYPNLGDGVMVTRSDVRASAGGQSCMRAAGSASGWVEETACAPEMGAGAGTRRLAWARRRCRLRGRLTKGTKLRGSQSR
jgi:hypothetical protein